MFWGAKGEVERDSQDIMMYVLRRWALNAQPEIKIDFTRYTALKRAIEVQRAALDVEQKFDLVIANYEEFEREILSVTLGHMVRHASKWGQMSDARLLLNRRIVNLLSTCRLYVDQVQHSAQSPCFSGCTLEQVKALFSKQYEMSLGYRVMEALRNHIQHRSLAISRISYPSKMEKKDGDNPLWSYKLSLGLDLDALREDETFKQPILEELASLSEIQNDIILFVRQHVEGIAGAHSSLRELITENIRVADSTVVRALADWKAAGHEESGLAALHLRSDSRVEEHVFITSNFKNKREELLAENQTHMNLSRRFVTNVRPREAYSDFRHETRE